MNVNEFLIKLAQLFPSDEPYDLFAERMDKYSEILSQKEVKNEEAIDYERTINRITERYPYRSFPNLSEILKHICYKPKQSCELKNPRRYIVKIMGCEYEFTEVDSSWEGVHFLSDFDNYYETT